MVDANGSPVLKDGDLQFPWGALTSSLMQPLRFTVVGKPAAGANILRAMIDRAGYFGPNQVETTAFAGSRAKGTTAPAATAMVSVYLNGTLKGTMAFAAGATTPAFTTVGGTPVYMSVGDVLTMVASAMADTTLSDVIGFIAVQ